MKKVFAIGATLLVAALFSFQPASAETGTAPVSETSVETITAPVVELSLAEPVVLTEPAPVPVVEAPVEPVAETVAEPVVVVPAPVAPVLAEPVAVEAVPAPVETAAVVPACQEDEPCWDCATMGNHICGWDDRILRACTEGPTNVEYLKFERNCKHLEAMEFLPVGFQWLGTGSVEDTCATYTVVSTKYAGTVHSYKDTTPSSYEPCNFIPNRATVQ